MEIAKVIGAAVKAKQVDSDIEIKRFPARAQGVVNRGIHRTMIVNVRDSI